VTHGTNTIVIFPGAGSFGSEFRPLLKALRPNARLLRYPWRHEASDTSGCATFDQAAQACAGQVGKIAATGSILLGHSFGAYLAYATAAILRQAGAPPRAVILVAARAPHLVATTRQPRSWDEIEAYWRSLQPDLFEQLPDSSWQDVVFETTRRDLALFEGFDADMFGRLQVETLTATGEGDPSVSRIQSKSWGDWTLAPYQHRSFPGGHSEFLGSHDFIEWVNAATQRMEVPHHVSG
jgi:surfactin synthase thioesterase subunit